MTYSPVLATAIWTGNHNGAVLTSDSHTVAIKISAAYMDAVHEQVYGEDGRWHSGMKIEKPISGQAGTARTRTIMPPKRKFSTQSQRSSQPIVRQMKPASK
jgi:hypothetical protein